jgi:ATP-dependent helicase YprA (DUF1998 family)
MSNKNGYTVKSVADGLSATFHQYLRAQYHIWDESLIRERDRLFDQTGITRQEPYIETTPIYQTGKKYGELEIPRDARSLLELASTTEESTGIPEEPYFHQAEALERYLTRGHDLLVATGTGSGKTETFLMPILGSLALERANRQESWMVPGVRALILYPMNALVNDQVSRLRKVMGNVEVSTALRGNRPYNATFGMYTGRTPYAGEPTAEKNRRRLRDTLKALYIDGVTEETKKLLLKEGKWPAKDIPAFIESGFKRGIRDSELLTRHEMQHHAPDLLITNYSMLEYMMLRPIEASIFNQTKAWLEDSRNVFTIVLDEAHMYRGSAGAEVAYLLRRLQARLGVSRSRLRYILTSASMGSGPGASEETLQFARKLTGGEGEAGFSLVEGRLATRPKGEPAIASERSALAAFDPTSLDVVALDSTQAKQELQRLSIGLGQSTCEANSDAESLRAAAYRILNSLRVAHFVMDTVTSSPLPLKELTSSAFGDDVESSAAIESLLALMAFAKDAKNGRGFASLRSHLFFRGLQGLYACSNRACSAALDTYEARILGALHSRSTFQCTCGSRVYELLTHRDCGAAYLRGYVSDKKDFLWHEGSQRTWSDEALTEVHAYVLQNEALGSAEGCIRWLHTPTGRLFNEHQRGVPGEYLPLIWGKKRVVIRGVPVLTVEPECPSCKRDLGADPKIMDLATKGEAPFSHLIKTQVSMQPASRLTSDRSPNAGRKSLLFSDGRQKAARLARDIPREIELDVFRQILFLATARLSGKNIEPTLDSRIYVGFLDAIREHAVSLFDGQDRRKLVADVEEFRTIYDCDLSEADRRFEAPFAFDVSLLRQLCSSFYSVSALALGTVEPSKVAARHLSKANTSLGLDDINRMAMPWIARMLSKYAFDRKISKGVRRKAWPYDVTVLSPLDGFTKRQKKFLESRGYDVEFIASSLATALCDPLVDDGLFISPSKVRLNAAYREKWVQCGTCKVVAPVDWWGLCAHCQSDSIAWVSPAESTYLRARKGFWHDPVVAVVERNERPVNLVVEEHTAQLSYKDADNSATTTEEFERLFRDILVHKDDASIDVLSSTTTMEVGIDIGSLIAVGMRNVPPMRQNYQQRAGRAGRRGSSVSSVVTYAQNGPHDAFYFSHPENIISGNPPRPILDTNNISIITRHVRAQLVQDFFGPRVLPGQSGDLFSVLGGTSAFYNENGQISLYSFKEWIENSTEAKASMSRVKDWLPSSLERLAPEIAGDFIEKLEASRPLPGDAFEDGLLDYMFAKGLLPSYAFPRDLCALHIEHRERNVFPSIVIDERPQQSLSVALSEYAPGKQLVVNKKTYRVGTVAANCPFTEVHRARALFASARNYVHCPECLYTAGFRPSANSDSLCPQCGQETLESVKVITPEVVYPLGGSEVNEYDDEQTYSRASAAQLPLPDTSSPMNLQRFSATSELCFEQAHPLVMVNHGPEEVEGQDGFLVCTDCGKVLLDESPARAHRRDYDIQSAAGVTAPQLCSGGFERVYLGYGFRSDVLVLRFEIKEPLRFDLTRGRYRYPLEDALTTLADALVLSMSRIMDIDVREINAGHRFAVHGENMFGDVFLYDTLSGGAGYASQAGENFGEIFKGAIKILGDCTCDTSCERCLRHYGNRFRHTSLDRYLALDIANYIQDGMLPAPISSSDAEVILTPLSNLLHLAGWEVCFNEHRELCANFREKQLKIAAVPSLLMPPIESSKGGTIYFSKYELTRDLPSAYAEIA